MYSQIKSGPNIVNKNYAHKWPQYEMKSAPKIWHIRCFQNMTYQCASEILNKRCSHKKNAGCIIFRSKLDNACVGQLDQLVLFFLCKYTNSYTLLIYFIFIWEYIQWNYNRWEIKNLKDKILLKKTVNVKESLQLDGGKLGFFLYFDQR